MILNIETSTTSCSVALANQGQVLATKAINSGYSHSENLAVFIDAVLKEANHTPQDLQAIAVSKGPGSYTGLRIGVSTAKGLAYGLGIPLIAVDTLRAMVVGLVDELNLVPGLPAPYCCPMLDARRMEVYAAVFETNLVRLLPTSAIIVEEDSFQTYLDEKQTVFFGPGAAKCKDILGKHHNATFIADHFPLATHMVPLAQQAFDQKRFEDVAYFEPFYLKDFLPGK